MRFAAFAIIALAGVANAHSWAACGHYLGTEFDVGEIDNSLCEAFPRIMVERIPENQLQTDANEFGADRGFNFQPNGNGFCAAGPQGIQTTYVPGQTVRVVWPAKNHDAEECTNPFIPDTNMRLFVNPIEESGAASTEEWTEVIDWKETQLDPSYDPGFQNCPDFCSNTDRAPCFQDFVVPDLADGEYTFMWYWEFNQGSFYTNCWDVEIDNDGTVVEPGDAPLEVDEDDEDEVDEDEVDEDEEDEDEVDEDGDACGPNEQGANDWGQCGGRNFNGPTCCTNYPRYQCEVLNDFYHQCRDQGVGAQSVSQSVEEEQSSMSGGASFAVGAVSALGVAAVVAGVAFGVKKYRESSVQTGENFQQLSAL